MTDRYEGERARRLAIVVGAEREIAAVARDAYAKLLAQVAADLQSAPVVAALQPIDALWAQLTKTITAKIGGLFKQRFLGTGAAKRFLAAAQQKFETQVASNLSGAPADILADIHALQSLPGTSQDQLLAELTPGHAEYDSRLDEYASRVSRTSAIAAFNAGDAEGWAEVAREGGQSITKRWLSSHDSRVRPTHVVADNDPENQAVPFDGMFQVGGFQGQYPGDWTLPPQETVNCRCTALYTDGNLEVMTGITAASAAAHVATEGPGQPVVDPVTGNNLPNGWHGVIAALDKPTGDKRMLMTPKDGVTTRQYPLALTANHVGDPTGYPTIGSVDRTWAKNGLLYGEGALDLGGEAGQTAARHLHNQIQNTVSIDPDMVEAAVHSYDADGHLIDTVQLSAELTQQFLHSGTPFSDGKWYFAKSDDESTDSSSGADSHVADQILAFTNWRLAGLAHVPIPAYTEARIEPVYNYKKSAPQPGDAIIAASPNDHDHSLETVAKSGPDFSDHSMVALHPTRPHAFEVKGGMAAKDLHVTLAYLGKNIHPDVAAAGHKAAQAAALALHKDHQATVAGYGHLGNDPERGPASVLFLNGLGVDAGRQAAMDTLNSGFLTENDGSDPGQNGIPTQHAPFISHMTLGYGLPADAGAPFVGKKFDLGGAAMHHGDQRTNYPRPNGAPIGVDEPHSVSAPVVYPSHGEAGDGDTIVASGGKNEFSAADIAYLQLMQKHLATHRTRDEDSQAYLANSKARSPRVKAAAGALIKNQATELTELGALLREAEVHQGAVVAAVGGQVFNSKFFGNPGFTEHTQLTIDPDGHVYGHVRQHGTCYQYGGGKGNGGFCLEPPDSACGYAKFEQHRALLDDGRTINVGALTFGDGHNSAGSLQASQRHYNDVATIAAKVNAGTDIFGVWINGQIVSAYEDHAYDLLLSPMSGHWEPDADNNGHLEMMAVHVVVTPAYTARTIVAGFDEAGQLNSLIITTFPTKQEEPEMSQAEIVAAVRAELARQKRAEQLMAKIGFNPAPDADASLYAIVAGATGSVDLPVASTSTPWDGGAAGGRILDRATRNGKINAAEASKGFLWRDGDGSKRGDYKFPFADVVNGVLTIIPRGVSAAAGRLGSAKNVDTGPMKSKICSLYAKVQATDSSWPDCPLK